MQNFFLPYQLITYAIILLIAFPVHEFSHAFVADSFGDTTPRANGRLTLNPLAHLDPFGTLLMLLVGFGWAKPVPINPYALQRRMRAAPMLVSLAGPMANFLLAIIGSAPFRLGLVSTRNLQPPTGFLPTLPYFLFTFIYINLILMLFNLIPIFPLDGEKVLEYFLPAPAARALENMRPYSPIILMAILFVLPMVGINLISNILQPILLPLMRILIGV